MAARSRVMQTEIMANEWMSRVAGCMATALLVAVAACDEGGEDAPCDRGSPEAAEHACVPGPDQVAGNLIMLDDNGAWSWFQDERAIVDTVGERLVFSAVANGLGHGGAQRDADVDVTTFELATGRRSRVTLANVPTRGVGDDHNAAALWQRPDGRYVAMYTGHLHHRDGLPMSFYRIATMPHDGRGWGPERIFTWPTNDTIDPIRHDATYSNLLYLAAEDRLYNIARASDRAPSLMVSDDWGEGWRYGGKLSVTDEIGQAAQYSNGYFKLSSNGVDRFDFIANEHHPEHHDTSIYHGFVRGGRSYDGHGNLVDDDIFDEDAPAPADLAPVWITEGVAEGARHHAWPTDLERDADGNLYALFTTRHGTSSTATFPGQDDHRLLYGRFDGVRWRVAEVAKLGGPLYPSEPDYTGLGAIHPNDPRRIYVSTPIDPRSGIPTAAHEIYEGVTDDDGASWTWRAITWSSTVDNLRPIVPAWDEDHTAVLWLRGTYLSMRSYDLSVVGILDRSSCESTSRITYVDANERNTRRADGSPLGTAVATAAGTVDDRWLWRRAVGNAGTVFSSNEQGDEDAPPLQTTLGRLSAGTYDVFVLHWANPGGDFRIRAGLTSAEMLVLRSKASQLAVPAHFEDGTTVTRTAGAVRMYRSYVGRVELEAGESIEVLVDDTGGGALAQTWYDGLGYARVSRAATCR